MQAITSRRDLISALSFAAELEHSLCCMYLFAAFSLKTSVAEGLTPAQLKCVQDWKTQLLLIAREEMGHLGHVCNLLTVVGGAPHLRRPNFPLSMPYEGGVWAFALEPFSEATIRRFTEFEQPERDRLRDTISDVATRAWVPLKDMLHRLCIEANWDYGEVWETHGKTLKCLHVCYLDRSGSWDSRDRFRRKANEDISKIKQDDSFARAALEGKKPVTTYRGANDGFDFFPTEEGKRAGFNTGAAVPLFANGEVMAVFVFSFETFDPYHQQDQPVVDLVFAALNPDGKEGRLPRPREMGGKPSLHLTAPKGNRFATIGGLYRHIRKGFYKLYQIHGGELFRGSGQRQVSSEEIQLRFPHWFNIGLSEVKSIADVDRVIDEIVKEGEGTSAASPAKTTEPGHFGRCEKMLAELANANFDPVRSVVSNPRTSPPDSDRTPQNFITHPFTLTVSKLFDSAYDVVLLMMMRFFSNLEKDADKEFYLVKIFLPMMSMAIRPLGEILTLLPITEKDGSARAGPRFGISREIELLPDLEDSRLLFGERLAQIASECAELSASDRPPGVDVAVWPAVRDRLAAIGQNAGRMAMNLDHEVRSKERS